jgi:hypothetical protein
VLSTLFRRLMLEKLLAAHAAGKLQFVGPIARHRAVCPISRGFLLWRLSDDGPASSRHANIGPSSETFHKPRNPQNE